MGFFKKLFGISEDGPTFSKDELIEAGACPNCWGKQEYDDQYVEYVKDQTKSNINKDKGGKKAFVQQFIENNVTGIRLKSDGKYLTCPACNRKHKYVDSKAN